jgi:hypothetical protein
MDGELARAIADGRVVTAKEHFSQLRTEDQRAVVLLAKELGSRLDQIVESNRAFGRDLETLKSAVEVFQSSASGVEKKGRANGLILFNTATLLMTVALLVLQFYYLRR